MTRTARKLMLAGVLLVTAALLPAPAAQSITCCTRCKSSLTTCDTGCNGNQTCLNNCYNTYLACISGCVPANCPT
jgi:hypothetical protein